ncbi:MAG TPA: 50S ribosomal protein L4 [Actinomyces sp.]|jgi:large subunit ribosomal protein L4|nr:50S ribosomal protein L4 [Acidobacteriota bacterium]HHT40514.1 50S ribosomal protein L4 [Actinomyces sp.]
MANAKTVDIIGVDGEKVGTVELPAKYFDAPTNIALIHQVVSAQLNAARAGTHKAKTRGEVRGGGKKPWRQKGTGRARHGSIRSPQWAGGGVVHGPQPRSYAERTPKKMKAGALYGALSDRARGDRIHVVTGLVEGEKPSTKNARIALENIVDTRKALVVVAREDELNRMSVRNLVNVHVLWADQLNTLDVVRAEDVVFTKDALDAFLASKEDKK